MERMNFFMQYDVIIIGAGPGGIFAAYELMKQKQGQKNGITFFVTDNASGEENRCV